MPTDTQFLCMGCMRTRTANTCSKCGWLEGRPQPYPWQLPPRTVLHQKYLLGRVLGQGGFGITYLAWDIGGKCSRAVKEYFPQDIAARAPGRTTVVSANSKAAPNFNYGRQRFIEEANTLMHLRGRPNIVSVLDLFSANDTEYLVMEYVEGSTLSEYLANHGEKIRFETAMSLLDQVMAGLEAAHSQRVLHRDISPDNIYIGVFGPVKILDFGSTRNELASHTRSQLVFLKKGYTPPEQYASEGRQGPWTDEYALAATLYRCITGKVPPEASGRWEHDSIRTPSSLGVEIPEECEAALMRALELRTEKRFQTIAEFRKALAQGIARQAPKAPVTVPESSPAPVPSLAPRNFAIPFVLSWLVGGALLIRAISPETGSRVFDWDYLAFAMAFFIAGYGAVAAVCRKAWAAIQDQGTGMTPDQAMLFLLLPVVGVLQVVWGFYGSFKDFVARQSRAVPDVAPFAFFAFPVSACVLLISVLMTAAGHPWESATAVGGVLLLSVITGGIVIVRMCEAVNTLAAPPPRKLKTKIRQLYGEYAGNDFTIESGGWVIGRDPAQSKLILSSKMVSRTHAKVWREQPGGGVWIEDLESTYGTFRLSPGVDGAQPQWVQIKGRQLLQDGARFRVSTDPEVFEVRDR